MPLQPPKKSVGSSSYLLTLTPPEQSPRLVYDGTKWQLTEEWSLWAADQRKRLIGELLSHGNWFSRPPRHDIIDPLFAPWSGKRTAADPPEFFCKVPDLPDSSGSASWRLDGLTMSTTAIAPLWSLHDFQAEPEQDTISLFGDGETADEAEEDENTREIQLEEIDTVSPVSGPPTQLRDRNWETKKFMAKERVREARLKAQIADRIAAKEESRFYAAYGDLSDSESHFSEYDLTDDDGGASEGSATPSQP